MSKQPLPTQDEIAEFAQFMEQNPVKVSPISGKAYSEENTAQPAPQEYVEGMGRFAPQLDEVKYSNAVRTAVTTTTTTHGGYPTVTIPKGTMVSVEPATNLPDSAPIDYWLVHARNVAPELTQAINIINSTHGIGFKTSDLKFNR